MQSGIYMLHNTYGRMKVKIRTVQAGLKKLQWTPAIVNAVCTDKSAVLKQVLSPGPSCSYSLLTLAGCSDIL